jgi:hypothetical protein
MFLGVDRTTVSDQPSMERTLARGRPLTEFAVQIRCDPVEDATPIPRDGLAIELEAPIPRTVFAVTRPSKVGRCEDFPVERARRFELSLLV